ncbi:hypothetical protein SRHO_G00114120 [Serrasalmus rhombeus]
MMGFLRVGSLNVNGLRDRGKQSVFSEFFGLKQLHHEHPNLRKDDGSVTSDPLEMRRLAERFYPDLFTARGTDQYCSEVLLAELSKVVQEQSQELDTTVTFEEVTEAVHQLTSGRAPGIDCLPVDFYMAFWGGHWERSSQCSSS